MRTGLLLAVLFSSVLPCAAQKDELPSANPARPTITNPATLAPLGYLQFEQGYLGSVNSPETGTQYGINQVAKLTVHPRIMLSFGSQPFAASTIPGVPGTSRDAGAIQLGIQAVLFSPQHPAPPSPSPATASEQDNKSPIPTIALGYLHTVYAGTAPDIDLGSATNTLLLLLSGDVAGFHYDTNYIVNEQDGDSALTTGTARRAQFAQTLSVNHSIGNPNLQLSVELYHFTQPFVDSTSAGQPIARANLVGLLITPSYQIRPNLVIDAGFERGLTSTSTHWQSFAGFTYVLPHRLWPDHHKS